MPTVRTIFPKSAMEYDPAARHKCRDCGALEGQFHVPGCDTEKCPFCFGQLISCGCCYRVFYPDYDGSMPPTKPFSGLPEDVYNNGLPEDKAEEWERRLREKGLIPYVRLPIICARCGECWPELFMADDWTEMIPPNMQQEILCRSCYEIVKDFVLSERKGR